MITQLSIAHFKAIASATIPLGPITVLVGPNDSGKSTILQALQALSLAAHPERVSVASLLGCSPALAATNGDLSTDISIVADGQLTSLPAGAIPYRYELRASPTRRVLVGEQVRLDGNGVLSASLRRHVEIYGKQHDDELWTGEQSQLSSFGHARRTADDATNHRFAALATELTAVLLRLEARAIARPAQLGRPMEPNGAGLVGLIDELLTSGVGDEQITRINSVIRELSPHVKSVATKLHPEGGKELHFALRNGVVIPASQISDGVVLATTLAALSTLVVNSRLLIEEPENGLHPRQLKIVADTIRAISRGGTQVVLTTHSPLLLNHFAAEEVVLVTRTSAGVQAQRMSDARDVNELASEMALGELWYNVGDQNLARPA